MNFINGITILLIYQLIGEITAQLLDISVPGPVLGMVFLFLTLLLRGRLTESMENSSVAFLCHLSLLFVPAGVGMILHFERIANEWLSISIALVLSTVFTMVATAAIMMIMNHFFSDRVNKNG
jgi:holin-like protein